MLPNHGFTAHTLFASSLTSFTANKSSSGVTCLTLNPPAFAYRPRSQSITIGLPTKKGEERNSDSRTNLVSVLQLFQIHRTHGDLESLDIIVYSFAHE
jgi:hypothetical protein